MHLYMSMLFYQLQKKHKITYNHAKFQDKFPLEMPMLYSGKKMKSEYVYIANALELDNYYPILQNTSIICLGEPEFAIRHKSFEMICIQEEYEFSDLFNEIIQIFKKYQDWVNQLNELTHTSQELLTIFRISEPILENPCALVDADFFYMVCTKDFFQNEYMNEGEDRSGVPLKFVNEYRMDEDFKKLARKKGIFSVKGCYDHGEVLCHNITYKRKFFARITMRDDNHPFTAADEQHLLILSNYIQTIFDTRSESLVFSSRSSNVHELLKTLAIQEEHVEVFDIDRILSESDWKRTDEYVVTWLEYLMPTGVGTAGPYLCYKIEQLWKGSCTIQAENGILWILNLRIYPQSHDYVFLQSLAYFLRESLCKAGISNHFHDISQIANYYHQAKTALQIGSQRMPTHWYHYFRECAQTYMLKQCAAEFPPKELAHPLLLKLLSYDEENHTDYYHSLQVYIESQFNITAAAQKLFIHRTTLINRLKRIQELYPTDFDDPAVIRHFMISFALLDPNGF